MRSEREFIHWVAVQPFYECGQSQITKFVKLQPPYDFLAPVNDRHWNFACSLLQRNATKFVQEIAKNGMVSVTWHAIVDVVAVDAVVEALDRLCIHVNIIFVFHKLKYKWDNVIMSQLVNLHKNVIL